MPGLTNEYLGRFVLGLIAGCFALLSVVSAERGRKSPQKHRHHQFILGILFFIFFLIYAVIPKTAPSEPELYECQLEIALIGAFMLFSVDSPTLRTVIFGNMLIAFIVQEPINLGVISARMLSRNLVLLFLCLLSHLLQLRTKKKQSPLELKVVIDENPQSSVFESLPQGIAIFDEKMKPMLANRTLKNLFTLSDENTPERLIGAFEEINNLKVQEDPAGNFSKFRLTLQGIESIPKSISKTKNSMSRITSLRKKPSVFTNPSTYTEIERNDTRFPPEDAFNLLNFENLRRMVEYMIESKASNMSQQIGWNPQSQEPEFIRVVGKRNGKIADVWLGYVKLEDKHQLLVMVDLHSRMRPVEQQSLTERSHLSLLATVAHEFRTPLNGTMLMMEASLNDDRVPADIKANYLEVSLRSLQRLMYLINDILDISQLKAQKIRINHKPVDVQKLVQDVVKVVKLQASMKGIALKYHVHSNVPNVVMSDENRMQQILINLLANAIKFTFNGSVELIVRRKECDYSMIEFCVKDTGIGISEADQSKIFQEFEKLSSSASINPSGVGLGLVISNNLAHLLGSGICFTSKEGEGAEFFFSIPDTNTDMLLPSLFSKQRISDYPIKQSKSGTSPLLKPKKATLEVILERKISSQTLSHASLDESKNMSPGHTQNISRLADNYSKSYIASPRSGGRFIRPLQLVTENPVAKYPDVLIVDDDPFCVLSLEMILKRQGYTTMGAYNGLKAVEIIENYVKCHQVDGSDMGYIKLIFIDCEMPVMDGFTACKKIKSLLEQEDMEQIPIIGCSGQQIANDELWKEAGMDDYLLKPLSTDAVLDKLSIYMFQRSIEELLA